MTGSEVNYTEARARLAELWDQTNADGKPIRLTRWGADPVVLIAADEFDGLHQTIHLLRSPRNAARLLSALERALDSSGEPRSVEDLRQSFASDQGEST